MDAAENLEEFSAWINAVFYVFVFLVVLMVLSWGPLLPVWMFLNSLQLIVHLPIMNVAFPANVMIILRVMMPVVMFDILEYKGSIMSYVGIEGAEEGSSEILDIPDQM